METYTYTTHTDGRMEREPMGFQEGDLSFRHFFILWHFHQRWRFPFGLGLGFWDSFPPVHKCAPPHLLVILSTFSSFYTFSFFSFTLLL